MSLLVNIRGCNGAGKSTIPMSMMNDPGFHTVGLGPPYRDRPSTGPYVTVFPTYEWVALGSYFSKTGGMDTFGNTAETIQALEYAWKTYPDYDIIMEGVIASTILSTYVKMFTEYRSKVEACEISPRQILIVNLVPPVEVCLARVNYRNGGRPINTKAVEDKWFTVNKNAKAFSEAGFTSLKWDNSKVPKEEMLIRFLNMCDKYRIGGPKCSE